MATLMEMRSAIHWTKIRNYRAEKEIDNSSFIKELGTMKPNSEERKKFIAENKAKRDHILGQFLLIREPQMDPRLKIATGDIEPTEFDSTLLMNRYETALLEWEADYDAGGKPFRTFVADKYVEDEYYANLANYRKDKIACTAYVQRIARDVSKLIKRNEKDTYEKSVEKAIRIYKEEHSEVKDSTLKKARDYLCGGYKINTFTELQSSEAGEDDEKPEDYIRDDKLPTEDEIIDDIEKQDTFSGFIQVMIDRVHSAKIKDRVWLCRGYTGIMVKSLKYKNNNPIETMPAGDESLYGLLKPMDHQIMQHIMDRDFVEFMIQETPKSLSGLEGVYWNLFRDGKLVTNKCLTECIRQKESISEVTVGNRLKALEVEFAKI